MLEAEVLKHPARPFTGEQRAHCFEDGALMVERVAGDKCLSRPLRGGGGACRTQRAGRGFVYDLHSQGPALVDDGVVEAGHGPGGSPRGAPRVRLSIARGRGGGRPGRAACAAPPVRALRRMGEGLQPVRLAPGRPGVAAHGFRCGADRGPSGGVRVGTAAAVRGSHRQPLHSMDDVQSRNVLRIPDLGINAARVTAHSGGEGSPAPLYCRTIHGSAPNRSDRSRPLLPVVWYPQRHDPVRRTRYRARCRAGWFAASPPVGPRLAHGDARCLPTGLHATAARTDHLPLRSPRRKITATTTALTGSTRRIWQCPLWPTTSP